MTIIVTGSATTLFAITMGAQWSLSRPGLLANGFCEERGDRMIGLARWQYNLVHKGKRYDLEVDTSSTTPMECAALIKEALRL